MLRFPQYLIQNVNILLRLLLKNLLIQIIIPTPITNIPAMIRLLWTPIYKSLSLSCFVKLSTGPLFQELSVAEYH